jgi:hypothetical protein
MKAYLLLLPFLILASIKKHTEGGSTFQADKKLLKTCLYAEKTLSNVTVCAPVYSYAQTFHEDGIMLLTSDFYAAYSVLNWTWGFTDTERKIRSTLDYWDTYVLSDIIKLTDTNLWKRRYLLTKN